MSSDQKKLSRSVMTDYAQDIKVNLIMFVLILFTKVQKYGERLLDRIAKNEIMHWPHFH
jgi:hypothetical protein